MTIESTDQDLEKRLLSPKEADDLVLELVGEFQAHLEESEDFMSSLGSWYFGLTDSGVPTNSSDRMVVFTERVEEGQDGVRWVIAHSFTGTKENKRYLAVMRQTYDSNRDKDGMYALTSQRVDITTRMYPGLDQGPKTSVSYTSYKRDSLDGGQTRNNALAEKGARALLEQVKALPKTSSAQ